MEDILAIIVVLATIGVIVYIVNKIIAHRREQAEAEAHRQELMDKLNAAATRDRERALAKVVEKPLHQESESDLAYMREHNLITASEEKEALRKKRQYKKRTVEPTPTPVETTSTTSSSNLLSDLADIAIIANTVHHWNDNSTNRTERISEPSVGVTTKESSWGFDDSDSRKSISSSMDTSSSWSSSSSSSSSSDYSSSDSSSPSSDW
jgi:hypothetical protein